MRAIQLGTRAMASSVPAHKLFAHADLYSKYRPSYTPEVFEDISRACAGHAGFCVDVGTGTGQALPGLAERFDRVLGVEPSPQQAEKAAKPAAELPGSPAVECCGAEEFADKCRLSGVDVITAFQAAHWFDLDQFYAQAAKCLAPGGVVALVGYGNNLLRVGDPSRFESATAVQTAERALQVEWARMYHSVLSPHWDDRRGHIDAHYRGFAPKDTAAFPRSWRNDSLTNVLRMPVDAYVGYIQTWSAFQTWAKGGGDVEATLETTKRNLETILRGSDLSVEWPIFIVYSSRS
jgi:SAM-dependent methyltransferase